LHVVAFSPNAHGSQSFALKACRGGYEALS
jgi:hypothetical protein